MGCVASRSDHCNYAVRTMALRSSSSAEEAAEDYANSPPKPADAGWAIAIPGAQEPMQQCELDVSTTTIQDLPPHLLACVLSKQDSWVELFRHIPLVCKAWHAIALQATPESLTFEFDLLSACRPTNGQHQLSMSPLQQLQQWWQRRQQQQQRRVQHTDKQGCPVLAFRAEQHMPWALWLQQHNNQVKEFSVTINTAGASCSALQCELKDVVLRALSTDSSSNNTCRGGRNCCLVAGTAAAAVGNSCCGSSKNCSNNGSLQEPLLTTKSSNATTAFNINSTNALSCSRSSSDSRAWWLQLQSLHLHLPLFERDVQLLADSICRKAPQLQQLTLVGYSCSTGNSSNSSVSNGSNNLGLYAVQQQQQQDHIIYNPVLEHQHDHQQQQQQQQQGQQPHNPASQQPADGSADTDGTNANGNQGQQQQHQAPSNPNSFIICHGFITCSSLQHLMASAKQLQSFTFACRQLYKTSWLAPATQLTSLALRDCSLTGQSLNELVSLNLPQLRRLDLSGNPSLGRTGSRRSSSSSGGGGGSGLELVAKLTRLTSLDISGWHLGQRSTVGAAAMQQQQQQQQQQCCFVQALSSLVQLAELRAAGCGLVDWTHGPGAAAAYAASIDNDQLLPKLTSLCLSGNPLSSSSIAAICSMQQLRRLDLAGLVNHSSTAAAAAAGNGGRGQQLAAFASCWGGFGGVHMPGLTELNLSDNDWQTGKSVSFARHLCPSIASMSSLHKLDLSGCKPPYKQLKTLLCSLPPSVADIVLDGCANVTRGDLQAVMHLPHLLCLSAAHMVPALCDRHVEGLTGLTSLQRLVLSDNNIGPKGLAMLVKELHQLTRLDVCGNPRIARQHSAGVGERSGLRVNA